MAFPIVVKLVINIHLKKSKYDIIQIPLYIPTEQYLTYPVEGRIQDRFSEGILKTMIEIGKETVENPENYDIRANHVWASTLALKQWIKL